MFWIDTKHVTIDGVRVHYIDVGEGPVVFLLHGLGSSLITWRLNVEPLVAAGYRVLALDLPGHGDSEKPNYLSYDPLAGARLIHRFFEELGVRRAFMVGNSAGGLIVGLFAILYPRMVERLTLVSSGGLGREVFWPLRLISIPLLGELFYQPRWQTEQNITKRVFYQPPPMLVVNEVLMEMMRVRLLPGTKRAILHAIRSSINMFGQRKERHILAELNRLTMPCWRCGGRMTGSSRCPMPWRCRMPYPTVWFIFSPSVATGLTWRRPRSLTSC